MIRLGTACAMWVTLAASSAIAGPTDFHPGQVITGYGRVATVSAAPALAKDTRFRVAFDVADAAPNGEVNRHLDSAARFLNLHAEAGVAPRNIEIAIVVHGGAAIDLTRDEKYGSHNANAGLIAALLAAGVRIELCGQTAAARDIGADDLLPGVGMALSAMTAHALLQQAGYTLNPF